MNLFDVFPGRTIRYTECFDVRVVSCNKSTTEEGYICRVHVDFKITCPRILQELLNIKGDFYGMARLKEGDASNTLAAMDIAEHKALEKAYNHIAKALRKLELELWLLIKRGDLLKASATYTKKRDRQINAKNKMIHND